MLDVHPPHQSAHTWRDFFIHIATIVLGLLIAVGLEQSVEYFHTRHEVAETRRALHTERLINIHRFAADTAETRRFVPILQRNLAIFVFLRHHPSAPPSQWPGQLDWSTISFIAPDAAWKTAQQNNVLAHMPPAEVRSNSSLYSRLAGLSDAISAHRESIYNAARFAIVDPDPSHLTPAQLDREIDLTAQVLQNYAVTANTQSNLHREFPDFTPAPTRAEVLAIRNVHDDPATSERSNRTVQSVYDYEKSLSTEETKP
jgi:hypothetical protein